MMARYFQVLAALGAFAGIAGAQTVTVSLSSAQNGQSVSPGATINWEISYTVSAGDNDGLALLIADLVQDGDNNPATLDIPQAAGVPAPMTNFSRPAGLSNPGEGSNLITGYVGVQRGTAGAKNLIQIGGGQNTFGFANPPGTGIAENATVVGGRGQSGAVMLASGSFAAPAATGLYAFSLANVYANTLDSISTPPLHSPATEAAVVLAAGSFSFTVGGTTITPGDTNCDGNIDFFDIDPFLLALFDPAGYATAFPNCDISSADANSDNSIDFFDIDPFIALLFG